MMVVLTIALAHHAAAPCINMNKVDEREPDRNRERERKKRERF